MSERFSVRIAALPATAKWDPSIVISTLPFTYVTLDAYQDLPRASATVFRSIFPDAIPDESVPFSNTMIDWAPRRGDSADVTTLADYELPSLIWNIRDGDGELYVTFGMLRGPYVIGDLIAASRAGYDDHDWTDLVVWRSDGGRGGDSIWFDMLSFLQEQGVTIEALSIDGVKTVAAGTAGYFAKRLRDAFSRRRRDKKARYLVRQWESRNITPYTLRAWFDAKSKWSTAEVSRRLNLTRRSAGALLKALGYAHRGDDIWTLSESKKARKRRAKWLKAEETEWFPEPY